MAVGTHPEGARTDSAVTVDVRFGACGQHFSSPRGDKDNLVRRLPRPGILAAACQQSSQQQGGSGYLEICVIFEHKAWY